MTQAELIQRIRELYINAREFTYKPTSNIQVLTRGTSHSISSMAEDLFGCYCVEKISKSNNILIYIDPQLSFSGTELKNKSEKRPLLIRPDIAFTKSGIVNCMFDIKTDLGYKRKELFNQAKERNNQVNLIKNREAFNNDGKTKERTTIKFSSDLKFIYVVISQGNISKSVRDDFISKIGKLKNVEIYFLSNGDHLNSYNNQNWHIDKDFNTLDKKIMECLK
jgi:hypothetical protein